ncbi:MAG: UDP-4-amino-4,6-dideoxy-N-acetyl-beta-L-altrosamine transaminase [Streptosporangiales bacterium]|nr:UDP-4-amino-4,6-dideoxy-N-acetyl-beta-L-altrosamine transaminase [Streptosporangiales bacterium]
MLPYGRQSVTAEDIAAVTEVLQGDWLTTGPAVRTFEEQLGAWAGGTECVTVTSGTAALHTAYAACRVGHGDEVVTTPMTFVATASCASILGATPVFADIDLATGLLDPEAAKAATSSRTRAVTAVDYAGQPADYDALRQVTDACGALLIADAAHSIGSRYRGRAVGSVADVTTFSFFPTKNLTTAEGGAVATPHADIATRARRFRTIGLVRDHGDLRYPDEGGWHQEVHEFGVNYRLPDVLCALGLAQLNRLAAFRSRRLALVERYRELLAGVDGIQLLEQRADSEATWHLFPVRVLDGRRREVYEKMRAAGIGVQVNYVPVYWHPVYADLGYRRGLCPNAEQFYAEELSLPLFPDLTQADQDRTVEALVAALG